MKGSLALAAIVAFGIQALPAPQEDSHVPPLELDIFRSLVKTTGNKNVTPGQASKACSKYEMIVGKSLNLLLSR
jgi:hypothetical protein